MLSARQEQQRPPETESAGTLILDFLDLLLGKPLTVWYVAAAPAD